MRTIGFVCYVLAAFALLGGLGGMREATANEGAAVLAGYLTGILLFPGVLILIGALFIRTAKRNRDRKPA